MRAAFVPGPGRIEVGEFPAPVPRQDGDVVVGMERASICGSDVHAVFHGFLKPEGAGRPGYPGHEGVGTVLESRSRSFAAGDRVLSVERVVVSDLSPARLAVARRLGAEVTVHAPGESLVEAVHELAGGAGADLVVEAVGLDATRAEAIAAVRVQGTVGCFGFPERYGDAPFPAYAAYRKSARVLFASGAQGEPGLRAFRDAVEHVAAGRVDVDHCLGSDFPLEEVPQALEAARDLGRGAVKIGVDILGEGPVTSGAPPPLARR